MASSTTAASTPSVKRLMKEWRTLQRENSPHYEAAPLEDNLFEWHFTLRGQAGTDFEGGKYHGRIQLPVEYPFKPPSVIFLTPNGRFQLHKKICLSMTQYHPEDWQPAWDIRCILLALISFMPSEVSNSVGDINYSSDQRKQLALRSQKWACESCGKCMAEVLSAVPDAALAADTATDGAILPLFSLQYNQDATSTPPSSSKGIPAEETSKVGLASEAVASPITTPHLSPALAETEVSSPPVAPTNASLVTNPPSPTTTTSASTAARMEHRSVSLRPEVRMFGLNSKQWDTGIAVFMALLVSLLCHKFVF
ncbi:Ubiquitin-conjugating enzyme E2 J1 [Tieghemiomyces parasiticus]|uniref:Ubiquitin-conjugating enzyme E2 J1 n=1 Tax=Tieghemiomyces parasiticus TaxID=78921 RepID=A0A9W8DHD6_9FUNG|nr:Ubiquitin-conjugating enzyme E2 J1 [Tieghemiomyces parasiticus]